MSAYVYFKRYATQQSPTQTLVGFMSDNLPHRKNISSLSSLTGPLDLTKSAGTA